MQNNAEHAPTPHPSSDNTIVITKLNHIDVSVTVGPDAKGLDSETQTPILKDIFAEFIGHPMSIKQLDILTQKINAAYRMSNEPFAYAYIPPQTVRDGVLKIYVRKYTIGKIQVTGNRWFSKHLIQYESGLKTGTVPNFNDIQSDLDWLNRNPFRSAEVIFSPGEKTGETDADIYTADRFPIYFFGGANNQNDPTLGRNGWFWGGSIGNFLGLDQILTYQYTKTTTNRFFNHAVAWHIPLSPRDSLLVYGNYAKSNPFPQEPFSNYGGGSSVSLRWVRMIQHIAFGGSFGLDGTVQLGYDWKNANSYQKIGRKDIVISNADTNQAVFLYSGSVQDPYGKTEFTNQMAYGFPGLTRRNNARAYETIAPGSAPNYFYNRLSLSRSVPLGKNFKANFRATHQQATKNLLYSEQVSLGAQGTVRGYYLNTSFGSISSYFNIEVQTKTFSLMHLISDRVHKDETSFTAFWDYGNNRQVRQAVPGIHSVTLASVGVATSSKINHWLTGTFDVGWRLRRARSIGSKGACVDYSMTVGF
ncbi:hemolysin activation/secretion protein [Neokomagataea thailandica NBRC 106555]|nr:hemolysin activation/secretion protein [Neokomagataea thailandica NBRC 106555]